MNFRLANIFYTFSLFPQLKIGRFVHLGRLLLPIRPVDYSLSHVHIKNCFCLNISTVCPMMSRPSGYKTSFMLNSAETKIFPAHKC